MKPTEIYVTRDGQQLGPYSPEVVVEHIKTGELKRDDLAWCEGCADWMPLTKIPGLTLPNATPPPPPQPAPSSQTVPQPPRVPANSNSDGLNDDPAFGRYEDLPWNRKSGMINVLLIMGLLLAPLIWLSCILVMTGDVYTNKRDGDGRLIKWTTRQKVVAFFLLISQIAFIVMMLANAKS